jgi:hypothetical protein
MLRVARWKGQFLGTLEQDWAYIVELQIDGAYTEWFSN